MPGSLKDLAAESNRYEWHRLCSENETLKAKVKTLEARIRELESNHRPVPQPGCTY